MEVAGTPPPRPELVPNTPGRVEAGGLAADIALVGAKAGRAARISFTLFDAAGRPVTDLQPYLGAMGHLVVLSADGEEYVHSHPLEGKSSRGAVEFESTFRVPESTKDGDSSDVPTQSTTCHSWSGSNSHNLYYPGIAPRPPGR